MELTLKQKEGLEIALKRYQDKEKYTVISGYAGTGKTTLVRIIVQSLGLHEKDVVYATFTGKAAEVLRKKGNSNAQTLHKLLYESIPKADGTFLRRKKKVLGYKLVIADECSMIPKEMVEQLSSYSGVHTIYLGDPFQIPPINPEEDNHLLDHPHCFLDEIMRQALDSDIIRVSMDIRMGKPLTNFHGKDIMIISKNELHTGMLQWADQIICATNSTRKAINNQMRQLLNYSDEPTDGDKLICCRNYWDEFSCAGNPIVNGTIGYLTNSYMSFGKLPTWILNGKNIPYVCGHLVVDNDEYQSLTMDKNLILKGEKTLDRKTEYRLFKNPMTANLVPMEFEYGYAITGHRAQGSQWDKVLVIEERFPFDKTEHARWLYTAITRAVEKCVIVRG